MGNLAKKAEDIREMIGGGQLDILGTVLHGIPRHMFEGGGGQIRHSRIVLVTVVHWILRHMVCGVQVWTSRDSPSVSR